MENDNFTGGYYTLNGDTIKLTTLFFKNEPKQETVQFNDNNDAEALKKVKDLLNTHATK